MESLYYKGVRLKLKSLIEENIALEIKNKGSRITFANYFVKFNYAFVIGIVLGGITNVCLSGFQTTQFWNLASLFIGLFSIWNIKRSLKRDLAETNIRLKELMAEKEELS